MFIVIDTLPVISPRNNSPRGSSPRGNSPRVVGADSDELSPYPPWCSN